MFGKGKLRFGTRRGRHSRRSASRFLVPVAAGLAAVALCVGAIWGIPRLIRASDKPAAEASSDTFPAGSGTSSGTAAPEKGAWTKEDPYWMLRLVNPWNAMPEGYVPELTTLTNGLQVDTRCYPALQRMMDDCRAAGCRPVICSAYRSWETQTRLFNADAEKWVAQGYTKEQAQAETAKSVAVPGTSEHQLGLALDIVDMNNQRLEEEQENTPTQQWLMANCWRYGFILRFPKGREAVTGISYEPWHYRYVGEEAARIITENGLCLEEYRQTADP